MKLFVFVCLIAVALAKSHSSVEEFLQAFLDDHVTEERVAYRACGAGDHNPLYCNSDDECCDDDICQEKKNFLGKVIGKKCVTPCYNYDYDNCRKGDRKKDCMRGPVVSGGRTWWYQRPDTIYKVEGKCFKSLSGCTGCLFDPARYTKHFREIKSGCGALCKGDKVYKDVGDSCSGGTKKYVKNPSGSSRNKCCAREKIGIGSIKGETKPGETCCTGTPYYSPNYKKWCTEELFKANTKFTVEDRCFVSEKRGIYIVDAKGALDGYDKQGKGVKLECCVYDRLTVSYPGNDRQKHPNLGCCAAGKRTSRRNRAECVTDTADGREEEVEDSSDEEEVEDSSDEEESDEEEVEDKSRFPHMG